MSYFEISSYKKYNFQAKIVKNIQNHEKIYLHFFGRFLHKSWICQQKKNSTKKNSLKHAKIFWLAFSETYARISTHDLFGEFFSRQFGNPKPLCPKKLMRIFTPRLFEGVRRFFAVGQFSARKNVSFGMVRLSQIRLGQVYF